MEGSPVQQIIISLIVLLLMGYVAYNIYLIELHNMFNGENDIKTEVDIINGVFDFNSNKEWKYNTSNKSNNTYLPIKPSTNQAGGAEYSYNFWLYVDKQELDKHNKDRKDIALLLKGEKQFYYNVNNYNCSARTVDETVIPTILTKNPLIRINHNGSKLAFDYNNILSPDSYQYGTNYDGGKCSLLQANSSWEKKNQNLLGIWDIPFDSKWFMVSIIIKEIADSANILSANLSMCKIYLNGMLVFEDKVETMYNDEEPRAATQRDNKSPLYINPHLTDVISVDSTNSAVASQFFDTRKLDKENILKMGDIKYFNYAINDDIINGIFNKGLNKSKAVQKVNVDVDHNRMVPFYELEDSSIKQIPSNLKTTN
jgi:hypothetical protein